METLFNYIEKNTGKHLHWFHLIITPAKQPNVFRCRCGEEHLDPLP